MALFKSKLTTGERNLVNGLTVGCQGLGMSLSQSAGQAEQIVRAAIAQCKQAGSYDTAPMGDMIVEARERTDLAPDMLLGMQCLKRDGATDDDIRRWWNRTHVERTAEQMMHDVVRGLVVVSQMGELGMAEAGNRLRKSMALFGDPWMPEDAPDEDKQLPWELRDRIMAWVVRNAQNKDIQLEAQQHASYNAFLRAKIRDGSI